LEVDPLLHAQPVPIADANAALQRLRRAIDAVDDGIASDLAQRANLSRRVALWKAVTATAVRDQRREDEVRRRYAARLQPAGWSEGAVTDWLAALLHVSRDIQARPIVAFQGGAGSWSDNSLRDALPGVAPMGFSTVDDAWQAVAAGRAAGAWIAVWNSTLGTLPTLPRAAAASEAWLERHVPVPHALLARSRIIPARIEGHALALAQCRNNLSRLFPQAEIVATVDGAHSAENLADRTAVLGPESLAQRHGLVVVESRIADHPDNATLFRLLVPTTD
jgi:chorismate mutase/prephenate dehydratase